MIILVCTSWLLIIQSNTSVIRWDLAVVEGCCADSFEAE